MRGLNVRVDIVDRAQLPDDPVGGSVREDALRYAGVRARISQPRPQQVLVQQGFEVLETFEVIIYPDRYPDVRSEDVVIPQSGTFTAARLKVLVVQHSSLTPGHPRSHVQLICKRLIYADNNEPETP